MHMIESTSALCQDGACRLPAAFVIFQDKKRVLFLNIAIMADTGGDGGVKSAAFDKSIPSAAVR